MSAHSEADGGTRGLFLDGNDKQRMGNNTQRGGILKMWVRCRRAGRGSSINRRSHHVFLGLSSFLTNQFLSYPFFVTGTSSYIELLSIHKGRNTECFPSNFLGLRMSRVVVIVRLIFPSPRPSHLGRLPLGHCTLPLQTHAPSLARSARAYSSAAPHSPYDTRSYPLLSA